MSVLVDTSVWSLALRRKTANLSRAERALVDEWKALVLEGRVRLPGIVRQEVLSGLRHAEQFERLRERLAAFDDVGAETQDYEGAARFFNACRAKGVTATAVDMLLCALAVRHELSILTADRDFVAYGRVLPLVLHRPVERSAPR
jgi:hypothetical protein